MIIHNFDVVSIAISPFKADPPLVVYADAVLTSPAAGQFLKTIGRRHS
jgi:hypothetical protein